jgi:hypothetical protein
MQYLPKPHSINYNTITGLHAPGSAGMFFMEKVVTIKIDA